ncbi:peptidoglycan DD-metalloendopeptidase family protein [bacterium]|nr:peptidoglycan DD-metalloendopeptidase family protein [bacterium]
MSRWGAVAQGNFPPTPYDGAAGMWHWKGNSIPERNIDEFIANMKRRAPNVKHIWVKFADGNAWQGQFDDTSDMAVNGPADIDRWVSKLQQNGMSFHGWIVMKGVDPNGEAARIIETAQRPGVQSVILDVEPYAGYWEVGAEPIRPLMTEVRRVLGPAFHIGLAIDPRPAHYNSIFPAEWYPFVNSVHTMSYWKSFRRSVESVIDETYATWGTYGRPIIPILQGDATVEEQTEALQLVTQRYGAKGVSWWRYGEIARFDAVNTPIVVTPTGPVIEPPPPGTQWGEEKIVFAGGPDFRSGTYTGRQEFKPFVGAMGWTSYYTTTSPVQSKVWAEWRTDLPETGDYQISVFIPTQHATTRRARYKIHGIRGTDTEVVVDLNQSIYRNTWVALGVFELVKGQRNAGRVFLNDVTGEADREIAFDAVRFRQVITLPGPVEPVKPPVPEKVEGIYVADGYDSPVGENGAKSGERVWPAGWRDATGFGRNTVQVYISRYRSYHTGVDLNVGAGGNDDIGVPVYSPASGVVIYQADLRPWGNVTVIRHDPLKTPTGPVYYSRFGHMQNVPVKVGERVRRGDKVGEIGTGGGRYTAHLHFDIARTSVLERSAGDWPGMDLNRLLRDYVDPLAFIRANRP